VSHRFVVIVFLAAALGLLMTAPAQADHLRLPPAAPLWMNLAAAAILYAHIGGGAIGLVCGWVALLARKGGALHRKAGNVFFAAMLVMSGIGGVIAPLLHDRVSTLAGFMTFYLIFTAWLTARRRGAVSVLEKLGLGIAITGAATSYLLAWLASQTHEHTLDGSPPQAFWVFATVTTIAAVGDLHLVLRGSIGGAQRIARHVWRMCFGLFVASGSLFLGQMQVFPVWLRHTPILYALALAPFAFLTFWMLKVLLSSTYRGHARRAAAIAT